MVEDLLVESLLKTSDSLIIFRRRSGSIMQVADAVDLLVYDDSNPRSVVFQLGRLSDHLADLPDQVTDAAFRRRQAAGPGDDGMLHLTDADPVGRRRPRREQRPDLDRVLGRGRRAVGPICSTTSATPSSPTSG